MTDYIIIAIIVVIVGMASLYIIKAKKSGVKCIGCPSGGQCAHKNNPDSPCSCGCNNEDK